MHAYMHARFRPGRKSNEVLPYIEAKHTSSKRRVHSKHCSKGVHLILLCFSFYPATLSPLTPTPSSPGFGNDKQIALITEYTKSMQFWKEGKKDINTS